VQCKTEWAVRVERVVIRGGLFIFRARCEFGRKVAEAKQREFALCEFCEFILEESHCALFACWFGE
jgi:hypothetical protein